MRGRISWTAAALGVGLATACAASGSSPQSPPARAAAIAMETKSWGRLQSSWEVGDDGAGEYRSTRPAPSGNFHEYDIVTQRFRAGPEGFLRLKLLLGPVERFAGSEGPECGPRATDLPYGRVVWSGAGGERSVPFDVGCQGRQARQMIEALGEAEGLVRSWAADQPEADVREVRQPGD